MLWLGLLLGSSSLLVVSRLRGLVEYLPSLLGRLSLLCLLIQVNMGLHDVSQVIDLSTGAYCNDGVVSSELILVNIDLDDSTGLSEELQVLVVLSAHMLDEGAVNSYEYLFKRYLLSGSSHFLLRPAAYDDLSLIAVEGALLHLNADSILFGELADILAPRAKDECHNCIVYKDFPHNLKLVCNLGIILVLRCEQLF